MADLQEQLQAILGDPEAMGQITAIARALTGSPASSEAPPSPPPPVEDVTYTLHEEDEKQVFHEVESSDTASPPDSSAPGHFKGADAPGPEGPPDLSALLGMLGSDIDPRLIQIALRVFAEYSAQDDQKAALLTALKPFLRAERLEKLEKAEKVARLSRVVRVAIQLLKEEGGHV